MYSVLEALIPCQLTAFEHKQPLGHFQTLNLISWRVFLRLFYLTSGQMQPRGTVKCKWVEKFPHVQIYLRVENFENEVGLSLLTEASCGEIKIHEGFCRLYFVWLIARFTKVNTSTHRNTKMFEADLYGGWGKRVKHLQDESWSYRLISKCT